ncbi:MAG: MFS transporter [Faecalicatena sp.]|uniref:MFS transporter n=1 Tax=Faecalicatena sp. TaxID=2005360 RepID=UPI00258A5E67|nr:MFS transporter [Faecalicatena sp.]MCI6467017.1 MFS transporter [Faecalicatena sp.]MCI7179855.1 MFS transporter [Lachnospiraceae bacterium]MDY5620757.1 MFS transporter [Lachnospiraceae bacterium]
MKKSENPDKLPMGKFLAWKTRDISAGTMNVIVIGYLTIFCTDTLGMNAALVGTLLMVSKIFDGIPDLFAGYLIDNTRTKWGKARPYELSVIGLWICTVLLFFTSPAWSSTVKTIWIFVMYTMVFSIFNTLLNANQSPYMIRAFSNNQRVIAKVSSYGGIISMAGIMGVSISFPLLMAKLAVSTVGWRALILIYAIPMAVLGIMRFFFVKEDSSVDAGTSERVHFREIAKMLKRNKYCLIYALISGLYQLSTGFGAGTYYFTYIIGDISKFSIVNLCSIVLLPIMLFFPLMMKKIKVADLFSIFSGIAVIGYIIVFFGNKNFSVVLAGVLLTTLLNLPLGYLGTLVVMQLASYNEELGLPRMESSSSVVAGFVSKIGAGVGAGLCGILLGASGFLSSTSGNGVIQPESAVMMIRCLYSILPGICAVLIIFLSVVLRKMEKELGMKN